MSNFAEAEIELCFTFWGKFDFLGLITWNIIPDKITIQFYFDDENINLEMMLYVLNELVKDTERLLESGWKPDFKLVGLAPEAQVNFSKKVNFVLEK